MKGTAYTLAGEAGWLDEMARSMQAAAKLPTDGDTHRAALRNLSTHFARRAQQIRETIPDAGRDARDWLLDCHLAVGFAEAIGLGNMRQLAFLVQTDDPHVQAIYARVLDAIQHAKQPPQVPAPAPIEPTATDWRSIPDRGQDRVYRGDRVGELTHVTVESRNQRSLGMSSLEPVTVGDGATTYGWGRVGARPDLRAEVLLLARSLLCEAWRPGQWTDLLTPMFAAEVVLDLPTPWTLRADQVRAWVLDAIRRHRRSRGAGAGTTPTIGWLDRMALSISAAADVVVAGAGSRLAAEDGSVPPLTTHPTPPAPEGGGL